MEPVTHILTGAVLARAGVHRRTAYAVMAMAIAAELPDLDMLWWLRGPVTTLEHHRGITHTFIALPVEAALMTAGIVLFDRVRRKPKRPPPAPLRWASLYAGTLLALLSHLLLDWTNNYGVRPFFPFNPRWYAGSFVFIFEPVLLVILLAALLLPPLFGLIHAEIGARRQDFVSPGWSYAGIVLIVALYGVRWHEHNAAVTSIAADAQAERVFASPHPINPFLWSVIAETPDAYRLYTVNLRQDQALPPTLADTVYKPEDSPEIAAAKRGHLGQVYLDWSMYPLMNQVPDNSDPHHPLTRVTFADARFLYLSGTLDRQTTPPLSGWVLLDMQAPAGQRVVETEFDGRIQR